MKLSRIVKLIILYTCLSLPSLVWADEKDSQDLMELAQKELVQGVELVKSGQVKSGIKVLRRAYRAYPTPDILMILGKIYDRFPQGCTKSLSTWRLLVDTCEVGKCTLAQEALARLKVSEIECKGRLIVKTTPPKAEVFLENQLQGVTPLEIEIDDARALKLTIYKADHDVVEHQVRLKRKWKKHEINLSLNSQLEYRGEAAKAQKKVANVQLKPTNIQKTSFNSNAQSALQSINQSTNDKTQAKEEVDQQTAPEKPKAMFKNPIQLALSPPLGEDENPFVRLEKPKTLSNGKITISAGRSMISELRCQYRTRNVYRSDSVQYIDIKNCDAAQLALFDRYYLALNLQQEAYIYVIMSNHKNQWELIFPSLMEDNLIEANQLTTIPNKEWILMDETKDTTDIISILASPRPIPSLESQRSTPNLAKVPLPIMRHFLPMRTVFEGKEMSAKTMKRRTKDLIDGPLVLHTSFRIYR